MGKETVNSKDISVAALSALISVILALSLWFFLDQPNHRIGGIAWNALVQIFGPLAAGVFSLIVFSLMLAGQLSRRLALPAAIVPLLVAGYCLWNSFPIMMSV